MLDEEYRFPWRMAAETHSMQQRYVGHRNVQTDIKEAVFMGGFDNLVAAGSDDGQVFIYNADTGYPVRASPIPFCHFIIVLPPWMINKSSIPCLVTTICVLTLIILESTTFASVIYLGTLSLLRCDHQNGTLRQCQHSPRLAISCISWRACTVC